MTQDQVQALRDLPIVSVAERLGLQVVRNKCLCPFHDDHHPSMSLNPRRNSFRCFVCGASGGTIDLAMQVLHKDFLEACRWLGGEEVVNPLPRPAAPAPRQQTFDASRYDRFFLRPWLSPAAQQFLFGQRYLDPRVVRWCRLTSWRDRQGTEWLQIPYYSQEGLLVGVQNRNLTPGASPRFRFPKGARCGIYNLPVLTLLAPGEPLYIAEGSSDCWALLSAGHKAVAIASATLLSRQDVQVLVSLSQTLGTTFHMYPDRDAPGERLFLQLNQLLPGLQHHQLPPTCKDFSDFYLQSLSSNPQNLP